MDLWHQIHDLTRINKRSVTSRGYQLTGHGTASLRRSTNRKDVAISVGTVTMMCLGISVHLAFFKLLLCLVQALERPVYEVLRSYIALIRSVVLAQYFLGLRV